MDEKVVEQVYDINKNVITQDYGIDENTMYLVVSDVHLGALGAEHNKFVEFLKVLNKKLEVNMELKKNLKGLLILGDFFDLCTDTYRDLCNEKINTTIYDLLHELQKKKVDLRIALGNHDIPVTGNYNKKFFKRKKKLIDEFNKQFEKSQIDYNFFNYNNFCQYILLGKNDNGEWDLSSYDNKKLIELKGKKNNFNILFAHGYQFESWWSRFFFGHFVWSPLIKSYDDLTKELADLIWNGIKKAQIEITKDNMKRYAIEQQELRPEFKKVNIKKSMKWLMKVQKSENKRKNIKENKKFNKRIIKFLKKKNLSHITHVIYGHTHNYQPLTPMNHIKIVNTGGWQHVISPTLVKIDSTGVFKIIEVET